MINLEDYNNIIIQWFIDVIECIGIKQKDMVVLLQVLFLVIFQVKLGKQKFSVIQMLIIYSELGVFFLILGE